MNNYLLQIILFLECILRICTTLLYAASKMHAHSDLNKPNMDEKHMAEQVNK